MKLAELQRRMAEDLLRPLDRPLSKRVAEYLKPNDRLTSVERLEIYRRSVWYRLLDSLHEDFPGLRAIVGDRKFTALSEAYLSACPSTSYTMRNLGSKLEGWMRLHPARVGRRVEPALDMVRLEWAHIEAFDEAEGKVIGPEDLAEYNPELVLALQPYVRLLDLRYPVDELRIQAKATSPRTGVTRVRKQAVFVAVHRSEGDVYYRHLEPGEFAVLRSLQRGGTLEKVVTRALRSAPMPEEFQNSLQSWVAAWAQLGWLCHPVRTSTPPSSARSRGR